MLGFIRLIAEGTFPALGGQGAACESAAWRPSGGGTPGTVEVRPPRNTIKGGGGTPGTVEVRPPRLTEQAYQKRAPGEASALLFYLEAQFAILVVIVALLLFVLVWLVIVIALV
jgi:hypothetical protein